MAKRRISRRGRKTRRPNDSEGNRYAQLWRSRGFVVGLAIVVLFMGISVTKEAIQRIHVRQEIAVLEEQVSHLGERNEEMEQVIALLNTSAAQDKQARVKLNQQSPGERVVIIPNQRANPEIVLPDGNSVEDIPETDAKSNPQKWVAYFQEKIQ